MEFRLSALYKNAVVVTRPKMCSQHKSNWKELMDVLDQNHGPSASRSQGIRRACHKTSSTEEEKVLIVFDCARGGFRQCEWQGENAKSDPFYIRTHHRVLCGKLTIPQLVTSFQVSCCISMIRIVALPAPTDCYVYSLLVWKVHETYQTDRLIVTGGRIRWSRLKRV